MKATYTNAEAADTVLLRHAMTFPAPRGKQWEVEGYSSYGGVTLAMVDADKPMEQAIPPDVEPRLLNAIGKAADEAEAA